MKLIDADALKRIILSEGSYQNMAGVLEEEIDNAPTIDAAEVVRCKECRRHKTYNCPFGEYDFPGDYMYCYYGERREDDK